MAIMQNKGEQDQIDIDEKEVYLKLMENYQAWQEQMQALKKIERSLRQDFLRFADLAKMKNIISRIND